MGKNESFQKFNYLKSTQSEYIDSLFTLYLADPESVDPSWKYFFEGLEIGEKTLLQPKTPPVTMASSTSRTSTHPPNETTPSFPERYQELQVAQLILAYRTYGKYLAQTNPLEKAPEHHPSLQLSEFGLSDQDLEKPYQASRLIGLNEKTTLKMILKHLQSVYTQSLGVEVMHLENPKEQQWWFQKLEQPISSWEPQAQIRILERLTESECFERFLHTRYVAQKRFSLEGGESLLPALDAFIEEGAIQGVQSFVFGMAHRGRLNLLTHLFGKKAESILTEFEGNYPLNSNFGSGDVKYHVGCSSETRTLSGHSVELTLASNPSHLEFINPIVTGRVRAEQDLLQDKDHHKVIPVLIHGDASLAGQGVCYESLNLSQLTGYKTGGTVHFVINNQVGFTALPEESRSTPYSTDVGKMLQAPIFHVNGDDPETVIRITKLAIEYRQTFHKDVFIDLVCYRKHGHNEGDEPSFTQPLLYQKIKNHPSVREIYAQKLIQLKVLTEAQVQAFIQAANQRLAQAQQQAKQTPERLQQPFVFQSQWSHLRYPEPQDWTTDVSTGVPALTLKTLGQKLSQLPTHFQLHPKLNRFYEQRVQALDTGQGLDWGNAEALAFATLLSEGHPIRLSGQDAQRGTFTHRHSVLHDLKTNNTYTPLNHLSESQASFEVHNSHLSETAVLGFEYGYSLIQPQSLVIWEAQFGDFANGAQVIIDQFLASAAAKWQQFSGLVLLLPHGYEGQGPEHSSARIERFLQLSAQNNWSVCQCTTPAQIFHLLRRQIRRSFRQPLISLTPKSLLRHPLAISALSDLTAGHFQSVIDDPILDKDPKKVRRVLLCSGKIYYDLLTMRNTHSHTDVALVRMEELYPWPEKRLAQILNCYPQASLSWIQDEPQNMGAWPFVFSLWQGGPHPFNEQVQHRSITYLGREASASPAVGSHRVHTYEQEQILKKAWL